MSLRPEMVGRSWTDWLSPSVDPSLTGSTSNDSNHSNPSSGPGSPSTAAGTAAGAAAGTSSGTGKADATPNSSRSHSPRPLTPCADDVMKLPKKDMHIFGLCPVQDEFVLVVCDHCGASVKMEAFASHVKLRHGARAAQVSLPPAAAATVTVSTAVKLAKVERNLRQCTVDLSKDQQGGAAGASGILRGTAVSHQPKTPQLSSADKELKVPAPPPPLPPSVQQQQQQRRQAVAAAQLPPPEPMEVEQQQLFQTVAAATEEIPDSTTSNSNVLSIPDTGEPLPHSMSGDIMAMMSETEAEATADSTTTTASESNAGSSSLKSVLVASRQSPTVPVAVQVAVPPPPPSKVILPPPQVVPGPAQQQPIVGGGKKVSGKGGAGGVGVKPVREYHPDKHCGVWDNDSKRNCTRALTCKSHSVLLKRKIAGRSKPFDELVAAHKKAQAAAAAEAQRAAQANAAVTVTGGSCGVQQQQQQQQSPPQAVAAAGSAQPNPTPTVSVVVSATATASTIGQSSGPVTPQSVTTVPISYSNVITHQQQTATIIHPGGGVQVRGITAAAAASPLTQAAVQQQAVAAAAVRRQPLQLHQQQHLVAAAAAATAAPKVADTGSYADENLHYTTDHPKPQAVCTFGARRIGGLLIADRSQFLTRKLVRVAITSNGGIHRLTSINNHQITGHIQMAGGGVNASAGGGGHSVLGGFQLGSGTHRIGRPRVGQPEGHIGLIKGGGVIKRTATPVTLAAAAPRGSPLTQTTPATINIDAGSYVVNYNPAGGAIAAATAAAVQVKRPIVTVPMTTTMAAATAVTAAGQAVMMQQPATTVVIPSDSFKTDIQDFKGGIKFERTGRKIKHILPSGGEIGQ